MEIKTTQDFKHIVLNNIPLIDVRAPIEFVKGAFPGTINLPIMTDEERHKIGIKYKEEGNEEAVYLGHELVSGDNKKLKINNWVNHIKANPDSMIFCFRGGQRSLIAQEWIQDATGKEILRLEGGYKAFRNYLLDAFEPDTFNFQGIRLGGRTGSGKTILLHKIDNMIDLEGIANHRGSSFGNQITPQPSPIDFENLLAYDLIQKQTKGYKHIIFEDEGRHVGQRFLPKELCAYLAETPLLVLEIPIEERANNILDEYVLDSQKNHLEFYPEDGLSRWLEYILFSIDRTKRRLGGTIHKELRETIIKAYDDQMKSGDPNHHLGWINSFLTNYYDPMYDYQLENNKPHFTFTGNESEVIDYIKSIEK